MAIDKAQIQELAELARIDVSDEQIENLGSDIESILAFVDQIQEVDVSLADKATSEQINVMREDGTPHDSGIYTDALLKEAPESKEGYVVVKKILQNND